MRRALTLICTLCLFLALGACTGSRDDRSLDDFQNAFLEAGYELEDIDTPMFALIGAQNGVMFYINGKKVAIYEYEDEKALKSAIEESAFLSESSETNGRFLLESNAEDVIAVFSSVK